MNPIENETVVAELLRVSEGSLELVDRRSALPGLLARPGLSTWKVLSEEKSRRQIKDKMKKNNDKMKARRKEWEEKNKKEENEQTGEETEMKDTQKSGAKSEISVSKDAEETVLDRVPVRTKFQPSSMNDIELKKMIEMAGINEYTTYEDVPKNMKRRIRKSCFPPSDAEVSQFNMEKCMRVLPQDMDTGGFFVALLKKVAPISPRAREVFQELEEELHGDEVKKEDNDGEEEPESKKAKVDPTIHDAEGEGSGDTEIKNAPFENGKDLLPDEKDNSTVVRGHVKKNYLTDKEGKKHATLGRDDFVPVSDEVFQPLKGMHRYRFLTPCDSTLILFAYK
jgi:hypothetical protein